ncbi:MAG: oligosaccharyl transferase, archaeosortase A system-associated, partial [Methanophagales archaeon]|nr:oligosaccharyl transferase, archaeosortase A system-associated [Methanophagales archaeon]
MRTTNAIKKYWEQITKVLEALSLGQKFVLFALVCLVITAIELASGKEDIANSIAIIVYFLLIVGVLNCFAEYLTKDKEKEKEKEKEKIRAIASLYFLAVLFYLSRDIFGIYPSVIVFVSGTALAITKRVSTRIRIREIEKTYLIRGILAFIFCLSLYIRVAIPYKSIFTDSFVKFGGYDPWYNMRLVENTLHHFPHRIHFDPFLSYHPPGGAPMGLAPLFDQMLAFIIWVIGLGNPVTTLGQHGIEVIGAWYPAVLVALTVFPVYFIGKEMYNRGAGLFSAGLIAILPGLFLSHSLLGFTDHHAAELLFSTITMLFFIIAVKSAREAEITFYSILRRDCNSLKKPMIYSFLAGIFMGCYFLAWVGAPLLVFILLIYALVQHVTDHLRGKKTDYLCIVSMPIFFTPLAMIAPVVAPVLRLSPLSEFHVLSLLLGILVFLFLTALSLSMTTRTKKIKPYGYPIAILAIGITSIVLLKVFDTSLYTTLTEALLRIFAPPKTLLTIPEALPMGWSDIWAWFTTTFFLAFAALAWIGYNIARKWRSEEILLFVWSAVMLFTCFCQCRFAFYYAVNVAILCGFLSWKIVEFVAVRGEEKGEEEIEKSREKLKEKRKRELKGAQKNNGTFLRADIIFTFIVILLLVFYPPLNESLATAKRDDIGLSDDWYETLSWMGGNTPDPGVDYYALYPEDYTYPESAYSVMSWWDYGHWITRIAHRIPVANPFQQGIGGPYQGNSPGACTFFIAKNETEANNVADALDVRYVVTDSMMVDAMKFHINDKYWAIAVWANETPGCEMYLTERGIMFKMDEKYFNTMVTRLHLFDGREIKYKGQYIGKSSSIMPFHAKPLRHYRLVYESPKYVFPHVVLNATTEDVQAWECYRGMNYTAKLLALEQELHRGFRDTKNPVLFRWTPSFIAPVSYVKVFEYVKGARIKGTAPDGSIVAIAIEITTNQGREFTYSQRTISNGSYEFVVPYSTEGP